MDALALIVKSASEKTIETCGTKFSISMKTALAKEYADKVGVLGVIKKFQEEISADDFGNLKKCVQKVYKEKQKAHGSSIINVGQGGTKIMYVAQVLKAHLIEAGFPID